MPQGMLPEKPGYHAVEQDRMLKDGKLNFYWVQVNNNLQAAPNNTPRDLSRLPQSRQFHRGLRRLSDRHGDGGRSDPAGGDVGREGRRLRQCRTPNPCLASTGAGAGTRRAPISGRWSSFRSASPPTRSGRPRSWKQSGLPRQDAVRRAVPQRQCRQIPAQRDRPGLRQSRSEGVRLLYPERACSRNTPHSAAATGTTLRPTTATTRSAGCAGRSLTARRRAGATARDTTLTSSPARASVLWPAGRQGGHPGCALRAAGGVAR